MQTLFKDGVAFNVRRSWTEMQGMNIFCIHEMADGSFAYADFSPVTNRAHLSAISVPESRERAEKWFDELHPVEVPELELAGDKEAELAEYPIPEVPEERTYDPPVVGKEEVEPEEKPKKKTKKNKE